MSDFQFSVRATISGDTQFRLRSRNFKLIVDHPKLLADFQKEDPIEFILSQYAQCIGMMGYRVAKEIGIDLMSMDFHLKGKLNPEKLLSNSYVQFSGGEYFEIAIFPQAADGEGKWEAWLNKIEERCLNHQRLSHILPTAMVVKERKWLKTA